MPVSLIKNWTLIVDAAVQWEKTGFGPDVTTPAGASVSQARKL